MYVLGGERAVSPAVAQALAGRWRVVRLAGSGRAETAVRIAELVLERRGGDRVLIARAGPDSAVPWADALAGGAYGAWAGVPVLLTDRDALAPAAAELIVRRGIRRSVVLGGPSAVADAVLDRLPQPTRVFGQDRAGTAAAVAEQLWGRTGGRGGDRLIVANGFAADAWTLPLAAAPLAARNGAPLLLADRDTVPPATLQHLDRLRYTPERAASGWLLGGEGRVGQAAADEVMRRLQ